MTGDEPDRVDAGNSIGGDSTFDGEGAVFADIGAGFEPQRASGCPESNCALLLTTDDSESGGLAGPQCGAIEPIDDRILGGGGANGESDDEAGEQVDCGAVCGPSR